MAKRRSKSTVHDNPFEPPPHPQGTSGRAAKTPSSLEACLADFNSLTEAWIHRCDEVWFSHDAQWRLDLADGAGEHRESPEWYEYAINKMLDLSDRAAEGLKWLKKGKTAAKKQLAKKTKLQRQGQVEQPSQEPLKDEKDYGPYFTRD